MKKDSTDQLLKWKFELIWWVTTVVIIVLIMSPVFSGLGLNYPFYTPNIIFITIFITFTRYIFLLKYTFFSHINWIKVVLIFLPIPFIMYGVDSLYEFQKFLDEEGMISIMDQLNTSQQANLARYIQVEKIFFVTGGLIVLALLPIRMIISIWRVRNRGTV